MQRNLFDGAFYVWREHLVCHSVANQLKMYDNAMEVFCDTRDIEAKEYAMCQLNTLEEIFGKGFFKND